MSFDIGRKLDNGSADLVLREEDANKGILQMMEESAWLLDFTDEATCGKEEGVSVTVGISSENGQPSNLVLSFAIDETDGKEIVSERKRTTIVLPLSHSFKFGENLNTALDMAADHINSERMRKVFKKVGLI